MSGGGKPGDGETFTVKPRYAVRCPACGRGADIAPSLFMTSGTANIGMYTCPGCGKRIEVRLVDGGAAMEAKEFRTGKADE